MIDQLSQYKSENGHILVPSRHGDLGAFLAKARKEYKNKTIDEELMVALDDLGVDWDVSATAQWHNKYYQLKKFKESYGHCNIGRAEVEKDASLKTMKRWISAQRTAYNDGKLSNNKVNLLDDIGFSWSVTLGRRVNGK